MMMMMMNPLPANTRLQTEFFVEWDVHFCSCLWNSLPVALRVRDLSLVQFKRLLKTLWFM